MSRELTAVDRVAPVREVAQVQPMFGAGAQLVIHRTTEVANALKQAIREQGLSSQISGREYVSVEGWSLAGVMLDVFPRIVRVDPLPNDAGYEAEAALVTRGGEVVGGAIAECSRAEKSWRDRDPYALKSMSQTRAVAKAYRMSFGFVMKMAGFEATPDEEMPRHDERREAPARPAASKTPAWSEPLKEALRDAGLTLDDVGAFIGARPTVMNITNWLESHEGTTVHDLVRLAGASAEPTAADETEQPEEPAEQPEPEPFAEMPTTLDGLLRYSRGQGLTDDQLLEILEVETISGIQVFGVEAAKVAIDDYLDQQVGAAE